MCIHTCISHVYGMCMACVHTGGLRGAHGGALGHQRARVRARGGLRPARQAAPVRVRRARPHRRGQGAGHLQEGPRRVRARPDVQAARGGAWHARTCGTPCMCTCACTPCTHAHVHPLTCMACAWRVHAGARHAREECARRPAGHPAHARRGPAVRRDGAAEPRDDPLDRRLLHALVRRRDAHTAQIPAHSVLSAPLKPLHCMPTGSASRGGRR